MSIEAMKLALEAIEDLRGYRPDIDKATEALRTAIQQAEAQQPATPAAQMPEETWYGHKFKEVKRGIWSCACGKTINEKDESCTNGTLNTSMPQQPVESAAHMRTHADGCAEQQAHAQFTKVGASQRGVQGEPVAWLDEMLADTREVFDAGGSETPQVVRDVIEYVASWVTVYREKNHPAPSVPDDEVRDAERYRWLADCNNYEAGLALIIDPKLTAHTLGEKIDAAMLAAQAQKGQG